MTNLAFWGDILIYFVVAFASISLSHFRLSIAGMTEKSSRRREFSKLMTHHVFGYENWYEFFAIVHGKCVSDQFRGDG